MWLGQSLCQVYEIAKIRVHKTTWKRLILWSYTLAVQFWSVKNLSYLLCGAIMKTKVIIAMSCLYFIFKVVYVLFILNHFYVLLNHWACCLSRLNKESSFFYVVICISFMLIRENKWTFCSVNSIVSSNCCCWKSMLTCFFNLIFRSISKNSDESISKNNV